MSLGFRTFILDWLGSWILQYLQMMPIFMFVAMELGLGL
jgi:hypothetical protein